jgi:hypothetical protein
MPAPRHPEGLVYEIAVWTKDGHIEEVLARAGNLQVAVAAYHTALLVKPERHVTLRQGTQVIRERKLHALGN